MPNRRCGGRISVILVALPWGTKILAGTIWERTAAFRRAGLFPDCLRWRSEEHTSELQSLMRISYAVFRLNKKHEQKENTDITIQTEHDNSHIHYATEDN